MFAAAFGPGPGAGVVVQDRSHDVELVLYSVLSALWTVVMRHVEHVSQLVSDGEGRAQAVLLADGAAPVRVTHRSQLRQT